MKAGSAAIDITPQPGIHRTIEKNSLELQNWRIAIDPLYAKALVIEQDEKKICIVQVDLNSVDNRCTAEIRRAAAEQSGFDENAVLVHATQTHSGPQLGYMKDRARFHREPEEFWHELGEGDARYRSFAMERIIEVIREADDRLEPATVGAGRGVDGRCAFNRRMVTRSGAISMPLFMDRDDSCFLEGPIDPEFGVLSVRTGSLAPASLLLNYTSHPVNLHPERFLTTVSADWPGALAREMRDRFGDGCVPLVLNGPCGDINPWDPWDPDYTRDHVRDGKILACTADRIIESIDYSDDPQLDWRAEKIGIPWRKIDPGEIDDARKYLAENPKPFWQGQDRNAVDPQWTRAATLLDFDQRREQNPDYEYEIQVLRIGEAAIAGLPGEPFVESALAIKPASPAEPTFVLHCPRWWEAAYIPTKRAYDRGGYETLIEIARFVPEALDVITGETIRILNEMFQEDQA